MAITADGLPPADEEQDAAQERAPLAPSGSPPESDEPVDATSDGEYKKLAPGDDGGAAPRPSSRTRRKYGAAIGLVSVLVGAALVAWASMVQPRTVIMSTAASLGGGGDEHYSCSWSDREWSDGAGAYGGYSIPAKYYSCEMTDNRERFSVEQRQADRLHGLDGHRTRLWAQ